MSSTTTAFICIRLRCITIFRWVAARLLQRVDGYDVTIVSGVVTQRGGAATGARPGRLGARRPGQRAKDRSRGFLTSSWRTR